MRAPALLLLPALLAAGCNPETAAPAPAPAEARAAEPAANALVGFPALNGRVVDEAGLLTAEQEGELTGRLAALEQRTTDQLVVVTVPSLGGRPIADYARALGNHWGIGRADLDNGALLVIAPAEREVRIAVADGLRPVLTDELSADIIDNDILPHLRASEHYLGIAAGVEAMVGALTARQQAPRNAQ